MKLPTLSVLLPNYNHARFVGQALTAILTQSVQPQEIIVIDDGSTDDSLDVLQAFARRHRHIRLLQNETNRGVNYTLNRALHEARGEFIYGAAADDEVLPGFFERSLRMLAQHPQAGLCCSYPSRMDAVTGAITEHATGWCRRERFFSPAELAAVMRGQAVPGHASIARRSAFLELGGWNPELQWFTDWYALQVIAFRHGACHIPATLALFRSSLASFYSTGVRNWQLQASALDSLFRRLRSPACRDLLPLFQRSGVLNELGLDAVRVMTLYREHQIPQMLELFRSALLGGSTRLFRDSNPAVRAGTARLLGAVGPAAWRKLPALVGRRDDTDPVVRQAAAEAIGRILGSTQSVSGSLVVPPLAALIRARRHVKRWLKPPVAWAFRTAHFKLYGHIERVEASLADCSRTFTEQRQLVSQELASLRETLEAA